MQPPIIEKVETKKGIQPGQNEDADREQPPENQVVGNTTEARDDSQPIA